MTDLEIKVAYLEKNLGEIDEVVRRLADAVDVLTKEVRRLRQAEVAQQGLPPNEKPPHY